VFSSRIPSKNLSLMSRSLATMLHSGVALLKALDVASRKSGHPGCRRALEKATVEVRSGQDLATALRAQPGAFPELYLDMTAVAEQTGMLPEVLTQLADHYENLVRIRRMFVTMIAWPVIQLFLAIFIVAGVLWLVGVLSDGD
jgi:type IV pilus assembly protein PilC